MPRAEAPVAVELGKPRVHFEFPRKDTPKEFQDVSIDDDVMIVLRGKVKALAQYEDMASVAVEYSRLELVSGARPKTMTQVLDELRGK